MFLKLAFPHTSLSIYLHAQSRNQSHSDSVGSATNHHAYSTSKQLSSQSASFYPHHLWCSSEFSISPPELLLYYTVSFWTPISPFNLSFVLLLKRFFHNTKQINLPALLSIIKTKYEENTLLPPSWHPTGVSSKAFATQTPVIWIILPASFPSTLLYNFPMQPILSVIKLLKFLKHIMTVLFNRNFLMMSVFYSHPIHYWSHVGNWQFKIQHGD